MMEDFADRVRNSDAHLLLISEHGVVVSLFFAPGPSIEAVGTVVDPESSGKIIHHVDVQVAEDIIKEIQRLYPSVFDVPFGSETEIQIPDHPRLMVEVYQPDPDERSWSGRMRNLDSNERIRFECKAFSSPEVGVVIVCVWALVCTANVIKDLITSCESKAEKACGVGKVKKVKTLKTWSLAAKCQMQCEYECKS